MKDKVIEEFTRVDLHDSVLSAFNFSFEKQELKITFELYDDSNKKYVPLDYVFNGLSKFLSKYPENLEFKPSGCYSAECTKVDENKYQANFLLEFFPAKVVWEVNIQFTNLKVIGGLSKKAEEYKYKLFNETVKL